MIEHQCPICNGTKIERGSYRDSMGQIDNCEHNCSHCTEGVMYESPTETEYYVFTHKGKIYLSKTPSKKRKK